MKKIILAVLIIFSIHVFSQSTYTDYPGKWRIGVNAGAMWQSCDVTPHAGIAGGFTIEKILTKRADALIGFAIGFRYLSGNCTGLDTKPSYGVANNSALNGTYDSTINYAKKGGYFYNNYKSYIHEGALELKINFPRFEQKTNLIFHIMGGIGICNYKTWINALDANGNMYDFTSLQNMQNVSSADVKRVLNGGYSVLAQGSSPNGTTLFVPSIGVGFGFKLSRQVALVFEYRASFPATNLLDGVNYNNNNEPVKQNDFYNYASTNLLFTMFGRHSTGTYVPPVNNTVYTPANTQVPQNNNQVYYPPVNNTPPPVNPVYNQQPIYNNQPLQGYPPYVTIVSPQNNYSSPANYISIQGNIQNIQSFQQINISQNGYPVKYFNYDPYNGNFHFQTFLQQGVNNIIVTANSPIGTGSQGVTIFYNPPYVPNNGNGTYPYNGGNYPNNGGGNNNNGNNPIHTTQNPPNNGGGYPHNGGGYPNNGGNTNNGNTPVDPTYTMQPHTGTTPTHTFHEVETEIPVHAGQNTGTIPADPTYTMQPHTGTTPTHTFHEVVNEIPVASEQKPVIQYTNPFSSPADESNNTYNVSASVQNVSMSNQITVTVNGNTIPQFNFNNSNQQLSFTANLLTGYNSININSSNAGGTASKSTVIDYKPVGQAPRIAIFNPATNPFTSQQANIIISGYVYNVTSSSDIQVLYNGSVTTFNYNMNTHEIEVPLNLYLSSSRLNITATNTFGNDAKQLSLLLAQGTSNGGSSGNDLTKPDITFTSPTANPYTSMSGVASISANVSSITDPSKVSVSYNGTPVSFSFNPKVSDQLSFTSPLKPGNNTFILNAGNIYGSVSKSMEITYVPTNPNSNVNGNPALHFTGGMNNTVNTPRELVQNNVPASQPTQVVKPIQKNIVIPQQPSKPAPQTNSPKTLVRPR
jgi:hypothetical protein